jgi:hypothetical protein
LQDLDIIVPHACYFFNPKKSLPALSKELGMNNGGGVGSLLFGACADEWKNGIKKRSPPYYTYDYVIFDGRYSGCFNYFRSYGLILNPEASHLMREHFPDVATNLKNYRVAIASAGDELKNFGRRIWSRRHQFDIVGYDERLVV